MPRSRPISDRFWEKVQRQDVGCWLWTAARNKDGYGSFNLGMGCGTYLAHRVAWVLSTGEAPNGLEVCHRCDNPACVRPDHLFLGTHTDNVRDCVTKGRLHGHRYESGECHRMAKLTVNDVEAIRIATGTQREIGARYGISQMHVSRIKRGLRWVA